MESCPECGKSFRGSAVTAERKLAQHCSSLGHSMSHRPSTCPVCLKEFFGSDSNNTGEMKLSQHMNSTGHCTSSRATCPRCSKTFHEGYYHSAQFKLSMHRQNC